MTEQNKRQNIKMSPELLLALKAKAKASGYKTLMAYLRALVANR